MPSQTFFNLPAEKRDRLIEVALEEFANKDYHSASISHIVRQTGIAQGSLYQYFANKKELYLYLLNVLVETKITFLKGKTIQVEQDFFAYLNWIFEQNLAFDRTYPTLSQLGYRAFYSEPPFYDLAVEQMKQTAQEFMHQIVQNGIEQGDIDPSIDRDLAVFVVDTAIGAVRHYLPQKLGISHEKLVAKGAKSFDPQSAKAIFRDLIEILKHGLFRHQE